MVATAWTFSVTARDDVGHAVLANCVSAMFAFAKLPNELQEFNFVSATVAFFFFGCAHKLRKAKSLWPAI